MVGQSTTHPTTNLPDSMFNRNPPGFMAASPARSVPGYPRSVVGTMSESTTVGPVGFFLTSQQPVPSAIASGSTAKSVAGLPTVNVATSHMPPVVPGNSAIVGPPPLPVFLQNFPQHQLPQTATASGSALAKSAAGSQSVNVAGSVPGGSVTQPVILPPVVPPQQPSPAGAATVGSGMADLADMERVLAENRQLTQQVTALIVQQYPLIAANSLGLRFAVCNELRLLQKLREERGLPPPVSVSQPLPSDDSGGHVTSTSVGDRANNGATANCPDLGRRPSADRSPRLQTLQLQQSCLCKIFFF